MSALKDLYSPLFYAELSNVLSEVLPEFQPDTFIAKINVPAFASMELKQRMRHTSTVLHEFLPSDFTIAVGYLYSIVDEYRRKGSEGHALVFIFLPDYIEQYGLEHYNEAVQAIEYVTQFITCEYAVRPFLIRYYGEMMQQFERWTGHESPHVRRLASEGSRPRLPWAMAVPELKQQTQDIIAILEPLKNDPSEYVRRSVANNLNDISKDFPEVVMKIAKDWSGSSPGTDALIRHACRGMLKKGYADVMKHYGLDAAGFTITGFRVHTPIVRIGDSLHFSFTVENMSGKDKTLRLEYGIYYLRINGSYGKKVFKISEKTMKQGERQLVERKQSFRIITTRVFYPGTHQISLIINGIEQPQPFPEFELKTGDQD